MGFTQCRCFTDLSTKAMVSQMDPLIAAAFHNQNCSAFCGLPEELLLKTMAYLPLLGIQCLRRTCRLFLRLYCSPEYAKSHDLEYKDRATFLPWEQPMSGAWLPKQLAPLLERGHQDYCRHCRSLRRSIFGKEKARRTTSEYMHCSGCRIDHPVGLFSATQRASPAKKRICIGREGYVRLCDHKVIRWADVTQFASRLRKRDAGTSRQIVVATCRHENHLPKHGTHAYPTLHNDIHPAAIVFKTDRGNITLELRWLGHLPVSDPIQKEVGRTKQATPGFIRGQLEKIRVGAAEFIAPEAPPGRLMEMGCFDPNRCACLRYSGLSHLSQNWKLTPLKDVHGFTCRSEPDLILAALKYPRDAEKMLSHERKRPVSHYTEIRTSSCESNGLGAVFIYLNSCNTDRGRCLRIGYQRTIRLIQQGQNHDHLPMVWYQALDPDSYNLTDDHDFNGVLWCRRRGCRNYYRYLRRALVPQTDSRQACGKDCPTYGELKLWEMLWKKLWEWMGGFFSFFS